MAEPSDPQDRVDPPTGLEIRELTEHEFRDFSERHASSTEIGRIATFFDDDGGEKKKSHGEPYLLGILGCGKLCAAACCTITKSKTGETSACKLDSVIVDKTLRKKGLAGALVASAFLELIGDRTRDISTFYAHSVHPATVRLLRRLTFTDPLPTGAPISSLHLDGENRDRFAAACRERLNTVSQQLKLQCQFCMKSPRRARPWCQSRKK